MQLFIYCRRRRPPLSPDDHDEEMGIDMQEGNVASEDGMDPQPPVHDDDDDKEACVGSKDGDDEGVPHAGAGNVEQDLVASANSMAEGDG
ncbi:Hypothetical predicted protein [Olea europaea subsp. europaea]|uniref:Uncharacterized protein n=1 Tax=Olea europaea subsp. europaea TaxID=158383 RepID=A0A8S0R2C7_OLEEU|nr:Hypothetical predicted protein [Olea europaea subsp. europaea]